MTLVEQIITYSLLGLSVLSTAISIVVAVIKARKSGKGLQALDLFKQIPELVRKAESMFGAGNGVAKLEWVMTQIRLLAMESNVTISCEEIQQAVDSEVRTLNYSKGDKENAND